jgi:hypothetical protein
MMDGGPRKKSLRDKYGRDLGSHEETAHVCMPPIYLCGQDLKPNVGYMKISYPNKTNEENTIGVSNSTQIHIKVMAVNEDPCSTL